MLFSLEVLLHVPPLLYLYIYTAYKGRSWKRRCSENRDKCFFGKEFALEYRNRTDPIYTADAKHSCGTLHFQ